MAAAVGAAPRHFQDIRALPLAAGGAVFFTHRVIHWGGASRAGYPTPRIACSWAATSDDYEQPYFSREHLPLPPAELRASLCAGQQLNYNKRFRPTRQRLDLYNRVFNARSTHFNDHYRTKVAGEYQWAKFELAREKAPPTRRKGAEGKTKEKKNAGGTEGGELAAEAVDLVAAPMVDLEEEMQDLFGEVGEEEEFEDSYWNGTEWVDN